MGQARQKLAANAINPARLPNVDCEKSSAGILVARKRKARAPHIYVKKFTQPLDFQSQHTDFNRAELDHHMPSGTEGSTVRQLACACTHGCGLPKRF
jgi:hypothetical protein